MYKKKAWIGRLLAISLSASLMMPMTTYASEVGEETQATEAPDAETEEPASAEPEAPTETVPETPAVPEPETPAVPEPETPAVTDSETPAESESTVESTSDEIQTTQEQTAETPESSGTGSNESLLASQQLVIPPYIEDSFRFVTIEKVYAIVQNDGVNVYANYVGSDDQNNTSNTVGNEEPIVVGTLQKDNLCYIIEEVEDSDWIYIESGKVRGFVKSELLLTGDEADALVYEKGKNSFTLAEAPAEPAHNEASANAVTAPLQTTADKAPAIVQSDDANVYASDDDTSAITGTLQKDNLCYMIANNEDSDWIYIESGEVGGFIKAESLLTGDEADALIYEKGEESFTFAETLVEPVNNEALTYTKTTTQQTIVDKVYAIATVKRDDNETLNIYEGKDTENRVVGELSDGALCYIIADADEDWIFIESNDVRGFVEKDYLIQGDKADALVTEAGEENLEQATEIIPINENKACYYTLTSIKGGVGGSSIRTSMLEFAQQFLGNPYVWGGTSLTNGADCSGFVQSIYAHYGYSLPRVAEDQAIYGMQIPIGSAAPGDLIFYARNGYVYHVVMYMGDGKVIHASSSKTGIIISDIDTAHAVWATRVIEDSDTPNIQVTSAMSPVQSYSAATAADVGEYLGEFKLTAYCACAICCGQWADGITASGTVATEGRTVAMAGVPLGTKLVVNGVIFTVEDRGTPYGHIDIFMNDHNRCLQFGVGSAKVYMAN